MLLPERSIATASRAQLAVTFNVNEDITSHLPVCTCFKRPLKRWVTRADHSRSSAPDIAVMSVGGGRFQRHQPADRSLNCHRMGPVSATLLNCKVSVWAVVYHPSRTYLFACRSLSG